MRVSRRVAAAPRWMHGSAVARQEKCNIPSPKDLGMQGMRRLSLAGPASIQTSLPAEPAAPIPQYRLA